MKWEMSVVDSSGCHFICGGHSVLSNWENSGRKIQELLVSSKSKYLHNNAKILFFCKIELVSL